MIIFGGLPTTIIASQGARVAQITPQPNYIFTKKLHMIGSKTELLQALTEGQATVVSDGSYNPANNLATAAWTIHIRDDLQLTGLVHVPGKPHQMDSFRAELAGLVGILEYLVNNQHCMEKVFNLCLICDGKSVLDRLRFLTTDKWASRLRHSDLLAVALKFQESLHATTTYHHVKGHADKNRPVEQLTTAEKLNVQMDIMANIYRRQLEQTLTHQQWHPPLHHTHTPIIIQHGDETITDNIKTSLYTSIMKEKQVAYWIKKKKFHHHNSHHIAWAAYSKALSSSSLSHQHFITKWNTHHIASGQTMKRWDKRAKDHCPFCPSSPETTSHILLCQSIEAQYIKQQALATYNDKLRKIDTSPLMREAINQDLQHWATGRTTPPNHFLLPSLQPAIQRQRSIGWQSFLEGFIMEDLITYQQEYLINKNSKKSALTWASMLIRAGWELISVIWQARNDKIHTTPIVAELEGQPILNQAIRQEYNIGISFLPARFRCYFRIPLHKILSQPLSARKSWFKSVRLARENYGDPKKLDDDFSIHKSYFRRWIGLP